MTPERSALAPRRRPPLSLGWSRWRATASRTAGAMSNGDALALECRSAEVPLLDHAGLPSGRNQQVRGHEPTFGHPQARVLVRVRRDVTTGQLNADPRVRRRRTLHPDQRALPWMNSPLSRPLAHCDRPTSKSPPRPAVAVEHRYRHHTRVENLVSACPRIRSQRACCRTVLGRKADGALPPASRRRGFSQPGPAPGAEP
jgi:hypothetical protein